MNIALQLALAVLPLVAGVAWAWASYGVNEHKGRWSRIIGRERLRFGHCPRCNSDAPAVDTCHVCRYVLPRSGILVLERNRRQQFPPTVQTKADWWRNFVLGP